MQTAIRPAVADTAQIAKIANDWGWKNPTAEILTLAGQAHEAQRMKSADVLVALGIVTREQRDRLLESKPNNVQTLTWFAQQDNISVPMERVLALMNGYASYDFLSRLSIHPCMQLKDVIKHAEELDAAIMLIEETIPVVVFSTFSALLQFRSLGREERMQSPILRNIDEVPHLAVGTRDEISAVLKTLRSDDTTGSIESANVWNAEAAENKSKPENREITRLLDHALKQGATDIAFKPFRSGEIQIQLRKYGEMISPKVVSDRMNADLGSKAISLLQAKSGANPTNTIQRIPTDGQITYRSAVGDAFLRLSFIPLNHLGEMRNLTSVSMRLLPKSESSVSLDDLKLDASVVDQIHFAMRMSQGLVLIVGPTNSGKSTTVAGCIGEHIKIFGDKQKRLSVEDPIERFLYGITQINVPPENAANQADERFGVILRAIKRHDPDVLNIGEVRDKETADLCVAAASTGHLVLSTLHANHTVMGFDVLAKTIEPDKRFQLVESMAVIIAQRLVKELCPHCRHIAEPTEEERRVFAYYLRTVGEEAELPDTLASADPVGCDECGHDGYIGLLPINEVLPFDRKVKDAAIELLSGLNRHKVLADARTITLLKSGLALLRDHKINLNDLLV